jgi:acyl carrier protein
MTDNDTTTRSHSLSEVMAALVDLVAEVLELETSAVEAAIEAETGTALDSLDVVEILVALEERFGIQFPDDAVTSEALETLEELAAYVRQFIE